VSLVEVLVTIGVIGIIFSISYPALMRARSSAGQVKSLSNAREAAGAIDEHARTHDDVYPMVAAGESIPIGLEQDAPRITDTVETRARWESHIFWPMLIADTAPPREHAEVWLSPGADVAQRIERNFVPSYHFSHSFVAAPALWSEDYQEGDLSVLRRVRRAEVRHPTLKAMVWDAEMAYVSASLRERVREGRQPTPIAFADLHAAARRLREAASPITNPLNGSAWGGAPLHNTPRGVEGRDF